MKKLALIALAVVGQLTTTIALAYSSLSIGVENLKYEETHVFQNPANANFGKTLKTSTTISSPVYKTGGLTRVSDTFEFSLEASSTLLPSDDTETWEIDGIAIQTNQVDMLHSTLALEGHFLLNKNHRLLSGLSYTLNTFKRFGLPAPNADQVIEERSATVVLDFGYGYESTRSRDKTIHYSAKALIGLPVYQSTDNTLYPGFDFTNLGGYNIELRGNVTYPIWEHVELGLFAEYSYMERDGERIATNAFAGVQSIVWPENTTTIISGGLILLWSFD